MDTLLVDSIHFLIMLWVIGGSFVVPPYMYPSVLFSYVLIMCHWGEGIYKQDHRCYLSELANKENNFLKRFFGEDADFWILTELGYWILLGQIIFLFWKIHPQIFDSWLNRFFLVLFLALYIQNYESLQNTLQ